MGAQPLTEEELAYYRAVEDLFARLRGTAFIFSPKDFALLRKWWHEGVPLAAVMAGIGDAFEHRRQAEGDVVSSLSYCRHAVARHARRLAAAAVGVGPGPGADRPDVGETLASLASDARALARSWGEVEVWETILLALARAIESLPAGAPAGELDQTLAGLEAAALESLASAAPEALGARLAAAINAETEGLELDDENRARTVRALRLRAVRELVGLPRLELVRRDR